VRLLIDRLATAVEEGCANRREQTATAGGERGEQAPVGDEPRPTRGNRAADLRARRAGAPAAAASEAVAPAPEAGA